MPLDAPATAFLEARSVKLSALLDSGLPALAADPASDAPPARADSVTAMHAVAGNMTVDENLQQWVNVLPTFRTPLEIATFFIGVKYSELGGAGGVLGSTTSAVTACPDRTGFYRHFQNGSIYWHPSTGAHEVHGEIRAKWASLGWERSFLGYPSSDETVGSDAGGVGRFNRFQYGSIYWYPPSASQVARTSVVASTAGVKAMATLSTLAPIGSTTEVGPGETVHKPPSTVVHGDPVFTPPSPVPPAPSTAHEVHGAIAAKYHMLGDEASFLGYPTTDETPTPDGIGRYNHFQAGSIYWTPGTGANEVHGLIRDYWAAHGWERNPDLGYPISDELIPDLRIGHSRPDSMRKPIVGLPVDRVKLPAEAAALGFPQPVVNAPVIKPDKIVPVPGIGAATAPSASVIVSPGAASVVLDAVSEVPFAGGPLSTPAPKPSRNRFADFENGVVFWRRGDTAAQPLAPWTAAADGNKMHLTAADVIQAVQPRIVQALGSLGDLTLAPLALVNTTGYSFDGVSVHNRRHRLGMSFSGTHHVGPFPFPVNANVEVQVEVAFEPMQRTVTWQIVDWHPILILGDPSLARNLHTALDPLLWSGFKLLQLPDTNAGAPIAVLSVKTMVNGDVNIYIES